MNTEAFIKEAFDALIRIGKHRIRRGDFGEEAKRDLEVEEWLEEAHAATTPSTLPDLQRVEPVQPASSAPER